MEAEPRAGILGKVEPGLSGTNSVEEREGRTGSEVGTTWRRDFCSELKAVQGNLWHLFTH